MCHMSSQSNNQKDCCSDGNTTASGNQKVSTWSPFSPEWRNVYSRIQPTLIMSLYSQTVNERGRNAGKWSAREAHHTWALERRLHFTVQTIHEICIHTGPKNILMSCWYELKGTVYIRICAVPDQRIYIFWFLCSFLMQCFSEMNSLSFFFFVVLSPFHVCLPL